MTTRDRGRAVDSSRGSPTDCGRNAWAGSCAHATCTTSGVRPRPDDDIDARAGVVTHISHAPRRDGGHAARQVFARACENVTDDT